MNSATKLRRLSILSVLTGLMLSCIVLPQVDAQVTYTWTRTGAGSGAFGNLWSIESSWSPAGAVGGPMAADSALAMDILFGPPGNPTGGSSPGDFYMDVPNPVVTNWSFDTSLHPLVRPASFDTPVTMTITGTLSVEGGGGPRFGGDITLVANQIDIFDGGILRFGQPGLGSAADFSAHAISIAGPPTGSLSGGAALELMDVTGNVEVAGTVSLGGVLYLAQTPNATRSVSVGALAGEQTTGFLAANDPAGSSGVSTATLHLTAASGSANFGGIIHDGGPGSSLAISKDGGGTQIFSRVAKTYSGGTTINAGTLLVNSVSGTGLGPVTVNGGVLGGTGFVEPTGANGISVASGGAIAPGESIGTLTIDLSSTTGVLDMLGGGSFQFELGAANASIGSIAEGSSDRLVISGGSAADVLLAPNTTIDLLGTATGLGYYLLLDTSGDATTWSGLALGGIATGGMYITGGLSAVNFGDGFSGMLILGDGTAGTSAGDIYLRVVPEPSALGLASAVVALAMIRRRQRGRGDTTTRQRCAHRCQLLELPFC